MKKETARQYHTVKIFNKIVKQIRPYDIFLLKKLPRVQDTKIPESIVISVISDSFCSLI